MRSEKNQKSRGSPKTTAVSRAKERVAKLNQKLKLANSTLKKSKEKTQLSKNMTPI